MMPKGRYRIMTNYMPKVGTLGLDMMYRTCTVQTNLDFSSEADMVKKLRVSLALQPVATALFANSPFTEGKPNGFLSFRSEIWRDTDNERAGMLPLAFEDGMGFERYVDYALDVPMYFVKRGDNYIDVSGQSFRDLLAGKLPSLPGERATISDWANHISTIFPEVRLKRYSRCAAPMAARGGGCRRCRRSGSVFSTTTTTLDACWEIVKDWTADERQKLRDDVPRLGFAATIRDRTLAGRSRPKHSKLAREGPGAPQAPRRAAARTRRTISIRSRISSRAARRRPRNCWRNITAPGTDRSSRSSTNTPIERSFPRRVAGARKTIRRIGTTALGRQPWPRARPRPSRWRRPASPSRCTNTTTTRMPHASACRRRKRSAYRRRVCSRR